MKKIFLLGEESVNNELKTIFTNNTNFVDKPDDSVDIIIETTNYPKETKLENIKFIDEHSGKNIPVLSSSLCIPVYEQASSSNFPGRLIGIGLYNNITESKRFEIAPSRKTDDQIMYIVDAFLKEQDKAYTIVPDRSGMVFPRIVAMIINEAAQVYAEQIANKEDIDTAMKLGTNYPYGPLEWADKLGVELVYNILNSLFEEFGEDRYRPHPSLREMVKLGMKYY
ncbi:MAG: 3-hydroxybutyryl-CoA dehydrogenase [Ignavibacteriae bacterium]|nr:MAG: 3-hydroxybutyryl-CoA dehydrogenase [Ignavibacteriota bacterium]